MAARAQTTSKAAQGLLPQLEAAIDYLNEEITQIRSGQKDQNLHDLIADPLPREQFAGLLQVWKLPPVPVELSKLFVQLEEVREAEKKEKLRRDEEAMNAAREKEKTDAEKAKNSTEDEDKERFEEKNKSDDDQGVEEKEEKQPQGQQRSTIGSEDDKAVVGKVETNMETKREALRAANSQDNAPTAAVQSVTTTTAASPVVAVENDTPRIAAVKTPPVTPQEPQRPTVTPSVAPPAAVKAVVPVAAATSVALPQKLTPAQTPTPSVAKADAAREIALVNLRALRRSMMLDVLSKIVSVAKSKGVDPAMFSSRANTASATDAPARSSFVDLEMIQREVSKGAIAEWEHFAQQVYLFCQHVIAESEKQGRQDAKQKGVELLHFAKTLTETLRKASLKKEETIMKTTPTSTPTAVTNVAQPGSVAVPARPSLIAVVEPKPPALPAQPPMTTPAPATVVAMAHTLLISTGSSSSPMTSANVSVSINTATVTTTTDAPTNTSVTESTASGAPPATPATTPHRMSTRLRHRENSVTDSPSPSRRRSGQATEEEQTEGGTPAANGMETRTRKRPRTSAPVSATDDHSASESQLSTSEAVQTATSQEEETKPRTRKRRVILPATRASSRQQKRRAAKAAAATDDDANSDTQAHDDAGAEGNDGDDDHSDAAAKQAVPLTKAGRPRKKLGRPRKKPLEAK